ncbi:hypothetical protein Ancab_012045 [Ancistrocladus abbreviatus]
MQATTERNTSSMKNSSNDRVQMTRLRDEKVKEIAEKKRRLVEVPYTASLAHTMNTLMANLVVAVPVAAPPGQWIGAGGSMIMEFDKQTGAVRKHYIGMMTMLDILAYIAGDDGMDGGDAMSDLENRLAAPVSLIIVHCLEGLSLWTLNPNTGHPDEKDDRTAKGYGGRLVGTLSATDIRGCPVDQLRSWLSLNVIDFTERVYANPSYVAPDLVNSPRLLVTCHAESTLAEVMDKVVDMHVHRVWVVDRRGSLLGLVSFIDMIRAVRVALLSESS